MAQKSSSKFDNRQSILSTRSESVLGYRLKTEEQQIWVGYILPAVVSCAIYIADVSTSVALAERHFEERNFAAASVTLVLVYTPPVVFCGYSVYKRKFWKSRDSIKEKTLYVLLRLLNVIAFPAWIIYRYAKQIFWSVEALYQRGHKREEALHFARKPSWIYLNLFLQAFLQAAPQAYFQLCILLKQYENNYQTDIMHVACILSSLTMLATTVSSFQRYESQKVIGRRVPWALKYWATPDLGRPEDGPPLSCLVEYDKRVGGKTNTTLNSAHELPDETGDPEVESNHPDAPHLVRETDSTGDSESTVYLEPRNIRDMSRSDLELSEEVDERGNPDTGDGNLSGGSTASQGEYEEPDGGIVTVRKGGIGQQESRSVEVNPNLTVPLTEAPPIPAPPENDSIVIRKKLSETSDEILKKKGIDLDEPAGKFIAFLWWFLFLVSRMTALAVAFQMSAFVALGIFLGQYAVTAGILMHLDHSSTKRVLINLFLSYVYLYALLEYKMRLKRPFLSNVMFFLALSAEDVAICATWYLTAETIDWWETYVFVLTLTTLVLSLFSFLTYFAILKPKSVTVQPVEAQA